MTQGQVPGSTDLLDCHTGEVLGFPRVLGLQAESGDADVVVVGCTVPDALGRLDTALDRALFAGVGGSRVVHGRGAGVLRRRLREQLSEEPQMRSWHPSQGDAATWVDIG